MFGLGKKGSEEAAPVAAAQAASASASFGTATYGGFWIRVLAASVDSAILLVVTMVIAGGLAFISMELASVGLMICALLQLVYWPVMHASARQATIGKQMLGLQVAHAGTGNRISILRALARDVVGKTISGMLFGLGFLIAGLTARKQSLHDYLAATVVVREGPSHVTRALVVSVVGVLLPMFLVPILFAGMFAGMTAGMMAGMTGDSIKPVPVPTQRSTPASRPQATPKPQPVAAASAAAGGASGGAKPAATATSSAEADLEDVYAKLHAATLTGDVTEMRRYATTKQRAELAAMPKEQVATTVNVMSRLMPQTYKIARKNVAQDGKTATLNATGLSEFGKQEVHGTVNFELEDGEWKVANWSWSSDKPGTAKPAAQTVAEVKPAPVAKAAAKPEASTTAAKPPVDPAERRRAREEAVRMAQAKRLEENRRLAEAFNQRCTFKPVMTDEEIDRCRPARR